eukprot:Rmarinus@m.28125
MQQSDQDSPLQFRELLESVLFFCKMQAVVHKEISVHLIASYPNHCETIYCPPEHDAATSNHSLAQHLCSSLLGVDDMVRKYFETCGADDQMCSLNTLSAALSMSLCCIRLRVF